MMQDCVVQLWAMQVIHIYIPNHTRRLILFARVACSLIEMFNKRKQKKEEIETTYTRYANFSSILSLDDMYASILLENQEQWISIGQRKTTSVRVYGRGKVSLTLAFVFTLNTDNRSPWTMVSSDRSCRLTGWYDNNRLSQSNWTSSMRNWYWLVCP